MQNKILESLAVGTPVVATSMGAEGLEPSIMSVADSPEEFARATVALMRDPAARRERAITGRAYIEKHCTWERALSGLDALLEGPVNDPEATRSGSAPTVNTTSSR